MGAMRLGTLKGADGCACLAAPERNRYFHGQMLYDRNFRLETDYHNGKRWLVNRTVLGYGVVCGLGVAVAEGEEPAIVLQPGVAIDRWGREIVVDEEAGPIPVPAALLPPPGEGGGPPGGYAGGAGGGEGDALPERPEDPQRHRPAGEGQAGDERRRHHGEEVGLHLVLCYHECLAEPTPVLAGDCRDEEPCQPGLIRERWRLEFRPGCLPPRDPGLSIPDVISADGKLDYEALVKAVSEPCTCPDDPCIPLANLFLDLDPDSGRCRCRREVDLAVRPIVYTNDLLLQLIFSAVVEAPSYRREK